MRKLAWLAIVLFGLFVVLLTLGITNYAGIGDAIGGFMQSSVIAPVRNFAVDSWLFIGTSGWYILAAIVGIGMIWIPFYYVVIKGLFWNKLVQEKMLHHTAATAPTYQSAPAATIPVTNLQSSPTQTTVPAASAGPEKKQES
jgi:hypothetical protein